MLNSRRRDHSADVPQDPRPEADAAQWGQPDFQGQDPLAEIVDLAERYDARFGHPQGHETDYAEGQPAWNPNTSYPEYDAQAYADALRALETQQPHHPAYDNWDDEALEKLAQDFRDYQNFEADNLSGPAFQPEINPESEISPKGPRFGLIAALLAGVALLGGSAAAYVYWGEGGFGEPVFVTAPEGPFKIVPAAGDTIDEPIDSNVVFQPRAGEAPKSEERLVTRNDAIPDLPGVTPQVNRVILPNGDEIIPEASSPVDTGPRRVRTVLIRPDGILIESPDGPVPSLPSPTENAIEAPNAAEGNALSSSELQDGGSAAGLPPLSPAEQTEALDIGSLLPPDPSSPAVETVATVQTSDPSPAPAAAPLATPPEATAESPRQDDPFAYPAPQAGVSPMPPARPTDIPPPEQGPAAAPAAGERGPLDLAAAATTASAPAAETPMRNAAAGSVFVQVSSQKSEAAALSAFQSLQRRFPDLLAGVQVDLQRADLGARGVYYRVRAVQPSREQAISLCEKLRAAGGDCIIAKR